MTYNALRVAMLAIGALIPDPPSCYACDRPRSAEAVHHNVLATRPEEIETYQHLRWMVIEALTWPEEKIDKLSRWLGFVQGVLWTMRVTSIEDLRQVNLIAARTR